MEVLANRQPASTSLTAKENTNANIEEESWERDVRNPLNWSKPKKFYHTAIPSVIAFVVNVTSSIYIPGIPDLESEFQTSLTVALLPYSFYVFGQAFGPAIGAPLSETFGRRGTYAPCLPIFILFTLGAGLSPTITSLVVCRFFAGVFGSPALGVGAGTVADVWSPQDRGMPLAILVIVGFLGPPLGPLIGSRMVLAKDWRWTQYIVVFIGIGATIFALGMKETYEKVLLKRIRKPGIDNRAKPLESDSMGDFLKSTLFRPFHMFFTDMIVGFFTLYVAFNFAVYYSFFAAFPYVFATTYDFGTASLGQIFLGLGAGNLVAFVMIVMLNHLKSRRHARAVAAGQDLKEPPEKSLLLAIIGGFFAPIGLFWFAWSARSSVFWISPMIATGVFSFGIFLTFISYALYTVEIFGPRTSASCTAAVDMLRCLLGGAFVLFTVPMYENLGIGWATSMMAFIVIVLSVIPWILYRYGYAMRKRSKYALVKE